MKKKWILFLSLIFMLTIVFPVYAKDAYKFHYESKSASTLWKPVVTHGYIYNLSINLIISHQHVETVPTAKHATATLGITIIGPNLDLFDADITSDLLKDEYTIPTFSKANKPTLKTTFHVFDPKNGIPYEVEVDLVWECMDKKTKISQPVPKKDPDSVLISYSFTSCSAQPTGTITIIGDVEYEITVLDQFEISEIGHFRSVQVATEPN